MRHGVSPWSAYKLKAELSPIGNRETGHFSKRIQCGPGNNKEFGLLPGALLFLFCGVASGGRPRDGPTGELPMQGSIREGAAPE